jgi:hypothetical protein
LLHFFPFYINFISILYLTSLQPQTSDRVLVLGEGFLGELDRVLDLVEGFLGELKLVLELVEGFLEELKLVSSSSFVSSFNSLACQHQPTQWNLGGQQMKRVDKSTHTKTDHVVGCGVCTVHSKENKIDFDFLLLVR